MRRKKEEYLNLNKAWNIISKERPYITHSMIKGLIKNREIPAFRNSLKNGARYMVLLSDIRKYYDEIEENEINF